MKSLLETYKQQLRSYRTSPPTVRESLLCSAIDEIIQENKRASSSYINDIYRKKIDALYTADHSE